MNSDYRNIPGLFITDLDGTLLNSGGEISKSDTGSLRQLRSLGYKTAIATGRSLFSFKRLKLPDGIIDFLIFSTGAGMMNFATGEIIYNGHMTSQQADRAISYLANLPVDFMIHGPIPDSHFLHYFSTGRINPDFDRRLEMYSRYALPMENSCPWNSITQLLAIIPGGDVQRFIDDIRIALHPLMIVWSKSPLDRQSIWVEIFSPEVSKGKTAARLATCLGIDRCDVAAIGNDTNDQDLLEWAGTGFVVSDAPEHLRNGCIDVSSNDENGVSMALDLWIGSRG